MRSASLLVTLTWLCANVALAQSRVAVRPFTGTGSSKAREAVVSSLSDQKSIELLKDSDVQGTAARLGSDLNTDPGRVAVARKLSISAFIAGDVRKRGKNMEVEIRVYEGRSGGLLDKTTVRAPAAKLAREVRDQFVRELGLAVAHAEAPEAEHEPVAAPAPEPRRQTQQPQQEADAEPIPAAAQEPEAEAEAEAEPEPDDANKLPALELDATVLELSRAYRYTDAPVKLAEPSTIGPAVRLAARWYPGAHFTTGVAANFGIDAYGQFMFPVNTEAKGTSNTFKSSGSAFGIGARFRVPLGEHQLAFVAGYGQHKLSFDNDGRVAATVPDVAYGFIRVGADARLMLSDAFVLKLAAAYLLLQSYGELEDPKWFPHVSGGGFEAALGLAYVLMPALELNAGLGLTRFFMSLHPELTDVGVQDAHLVAGGLVDQYIAFMLGATLRL
jgi:hypothetical protein